MHKVEELAKIFRCSVCKISASINSIFTLFKAALFLAIFKALTEISIAETVAVGSFLAKEIGMQPDPVPISRICSDFDVLLLCSFAASKRIHSTNSSVSGLGISVFSSTKKGNP